MVHIVLKIKANLENVAKISLPEGHTYCLKVKDSQGEDERDGVRVTCADEHEIPNSKGTTNFMMKWAKDSKHVATLNVVSLKGVTRDYTAEDERKFVPIIAFECRGLDPIDWHPEGNFTVESTSGRVFTDVDLSEREWMDFDDKLGESIGIYELEWEFAAVKNK